jgi:hypothetical protein
MTPAIEMQKPKYATRAIGRVYEVYEIASGETIARLPFGKTEDSRGKAAGMANATRNDLNADRK